jgi:hypothetical protein
MSSPDEIEAVDVENALASSQAEERAELAEDIQREQSLDDRLVAALSPKKASEG